MGASGFELVDVVEIGEGTEPPDDEVDATFRDLVYTVRFIAVCQRRAKISTKKENGSLSSLSPLLKPEVPKSLEITGRNELA